MRRCALALVAAAALAPSVALAQDFAVTGVTAWTMTGDQPVRNATIVVRGGRIESVEAGGPVPAGVAEVPGKGAVVTPGLFNAATQVGLVELSSAKATRDMATTWDGASSGFDVSYALNGNSLVVQLARADGMTGALTYPAPSAKMPFGGEAAVIELREGVDIVDRARAALVVYIGGAQWQKQAGSRAAQWESLFGLLDHAREERHEHEGGKGDHGEGHGGGHGPGRGPSEADKDAVDAVLAGTAPLVVFTDRESDIRQVVALGREYGVHPVIVGGAQAWRVARDLAAAKIPVVVTPSLDLPVSFDELASRSDNAAILARAGVPVAFGQVGGVISVTFNAGLALRQEAGIAVANGMPFIEALRAVTTVPRAIYGGAAGEGTLAKGQKATFVLWDGDPLEPATLAQQVFIDGQAASIETRQDLLAKRYFGK